MTTTSHSVLQARAERIKELKDILAGELASIEESSDNDATKASLKNLVNVLFRNAVKEVENGNCDEPTIWLNPLVEAQARLG
jgi:uncharacterized protein YcbK (DUF882 family)